MGDVTVNHLELLGQAQVSARWWVAGGGQLKLKQATRVPGEESYLRGKINGRVSTRLSKGATSGVFFRVSREDARDPALAQVASQVLGVEGRWNRTRKFVGLVRGTWYWLDYNRTALLDPQSGNRAIRGTRQADVFEGIHPGSAGLPRGIVPPWIWVFGQSFQQFWIWISGTQGPNVFDETYWIYN